MSQPRLIICEKSGRWAVAMRRALADRTERIVEARSLRGCSRLVNLHPASIVAIEVAAANLDVVLTAVAHWRQRWPRCRVMAVVEPELVAAEVLLREAGVVAVLRATREAPAAARLVERHFAAVPAADLPLEQAILSSLPWAKWAAQPA